MKIVLAKTAGFCSGVQSAVEKISRILNSVSPVYIDGDLIHNPQTIEALRSRGLINLKNSSMPDSVPVAIRTHGVTESDLKEKIAHSSRLINLTCPRVSRVQGIIKKNAKKGSFVIIAGDENHPEVLSLKSYAYSGYKVVAKPEDLDDLARDGHHILVSQTTFDKEIFNAIRLHAEFIFQNNLSVHSTICDSTFNRQHEVDEAISAGADTVVVIGGKHSANTKSLAEIGRLRGTNTVHIETENELKPHIFSKTRQVFVTAGASTPRWIVDNVIETIWLIRLAKLSKIISLMYKVINTKSAAILLSSASIFIFAFKQGAMISLGIWLPLSSAAIYLSLASSSLISEIPFIKVTKPETAKRIIRMFLPLLFISLISGIAFSAFYQLSISTQILLASIPLTGMALNLLRYYKYKGIPSWIGTHAIFSGGIFSALLLSGVAFQPSAAFTWIVTTMSILLCSPAELMDSESDLITGRRSFPSTFGIPLYLTILTFFCIVSSVYYCLSFGISYVMIFYPALAIIPVVVVFKRPICPSRARVAQILSGLVFAIVLLIL
jgi:4-hydroxy-3-methylbut-2-en-1-yl diphosphate reductase